MTRPATLRLGFFHQPVGRHPAAWRRAEARGAPEDLASVMAAAQKAEAGLFDVFFLADSLVGPIPNGNGRNGGFEPLTLLSALSLVTSRIGLTATVSTTFSEPFNTARMFASLDHLSAGRAGWNVVTSQSDRAAQNFSQDGLLSHPERYARADEFVQVAKGLWDTWDDGALVMDRERGIFVDQTRVRELAHDGVHFSVRGPLNVSRPPQGHPVIFQAGSSADGIDLAGKSADVAFTAQDTIEDALAYRDALRSASRRHRPTFDGPLIFPGIMPIVGATRAAAHAKFADLQAHTDIAAGIKQLSGRWGYDLSTYDLDGPVPEPGLRIHGESRVRLLLNKARTEGYSLRDLAALAIASHGHRIIVGSYEDIADDLEAWFTAGAADGFNVIPATMPDGLDDFVDLVVPELQRRGLFRTAYEGRTLRENLGLARPA
ncbi:LLM class flavin-dependent oxidoreductase [Alcaligenaceae bacterium A4P071]|nr:LLM class flavin-dependent oxidoreductase [Alcaligenaceae bacterium A4P071]